MSNYTVLSEIPGDAGDVLYISENGLSAENGTDGVAVQFELTASKKWIGIFAFGDMLSARNSKVISGPGKNCVTIVANGLAYIVSHLDYNLITCVNSCQVMDAILSLDRQKIIFYDFTEVLAYSENGLLWLSPRISWDGLRDVQVLSDAVIGKGWDAPTERHVDFRIDIETGECVGGASP